MPLFPMSSLHLLARLLLMTSYQQAACTRLLREVLRAVKTLERRAVILRGWAGLTLALLGGDEPHTAEDSVLSAYAATHCCFIDSVAHSFLFPRCARCLGVPWILSPKNPGLCHALFPRCARCLGVSRPFFQITNTVGKYDGAGVEARHAAISDTMHLGCPAFLLSPSQMVSLNTEGSACVSRWSIHI
jgi:hypothetical protein